MIESFRGGRLVAHVKSLDHLITLTKTGRELIACWHDSGKPQGMRVISKRDWEESNNRKITRLHTTLEGRRNKQAGLRISCRGKKV